jgi:hypothetical protein
MAFKIILENSAGVLDETVVETEEETRNAVLELASGLAYFSHGDTIRVVEID